MFRFGVGIIRFSRVNVARPRVQWLHSTRRHRINPLLPFDVLEEVQNEDLEEENEKLSKQKKKLIREKKKMQKKEKEEKEGKEGEKKEEKKQDTEKKEENDSKQFQSVNDTVPLKKAVAPHPDPHSIEKEGKERSTTNETEEPEKTETDENGKNDRSLENDATDSEPAEPESKSPQSLGNGGNNNNNNNENKDNEKEEKEEKDEDEEFEEKYEPSAFKKNLEKLGKFLFKCLETIGITFSSVAILGVAGLLYHKYYNLHVLDKIDKAFQSGDPAYQLAIHKKTLKSSENNDDLSKFWVERPQQELLDDIVSGKIIGRYYLVLGEKGTGKTTLLMESMKKINGTNVAIFDAHADPEIFRIRLGKALNFAYSEDYIGSLFSIRGPRDTTALLDIERAFNKLEELAIKRTMKEKEGTHKPLIMIVNNAHLIKENEEGIKLVELLQQKAESMSGSGLLTMIFNSDDYWVYEKLKKLGTRLELINVRDFDRVETINALKYIREKFYPDTKYPELKLDDEKCNKIYDLIGGRPQHISQVARHKDIFRACHEIIDREKTWLLNQCGLLGGGMDDDVMESGKFSVSCMTLMREFVEMDRNRIKKLRKKARKNTEDGPNELFNELSDHHLPELPLWRARQIMTRPDYIQQYDNLNIFMLDSNSRVKADSVPMMRAFHEISSQPHFDELLSETTQRVADIESLNRTREIVAKDLNLGSNYEITKKNDKVTVGIKRTAKQIELHGEPEEEPDIGEKEEEDHEDEMFLENIHRYEKEKWWKRRMGPYDYVPSQSDPNDIDINRG